MVNRAAEAGATHVKMQTIFSEDLTPRECFEEGVMEENGVRKTIKRPYAPELERLSTLDLTWEDHERFIEAARGAGVIPLTTIFSRVRIARAAVLPWPERVVKVASYDCGSHTMIRELLQHFDHLVISTGASFDEEIVETARIVNEAGKRLTFLHCVTSYPNALSMANLARMRWLRQFTPDVGWSDHTLVSRDGIKAAKVALSEGASWIERHFTVQSADKTKDGPVSVTPELLRELAAFSRIPREEMRERISREVPEWRDLIGHETRELTHAEMLNRDYYRGRFASNVHGKWIYNWEEREIA